MPLEPGFTDIAQGIRTFQEVGDNHRFVADRFGEQQPGGLLVTGPLVVIRASSPDAAAIAHGDDPEVDTAVFLTHVNWHSWNEPRLPMLGAWLPGLPVGGQYTMTQVVASLPAAALPVHPSLSVAVRASLMQNVLLYVFHQANAGAHLTYRVYC